MSIQFIGLLDSSWQVEDIPGPWPSGTCYRPFFWIWARHGRPAEVSEAPGLFPVKEKKWGEISSKSEQTWFLYAFSFAELLYVLEIQTNIEWITNKKPAGSHEYVWFRIDQSESKITIKSSYDSWLYTISSCFYDVQLFYPDSILCLWLNHV